MRNGVQLEARVHLPVEFFGEGPDHGVDVEGGASAPWLRRVGRGGRARLVLAARHRGRHHAQLARD
eukprot:1618528-Pleurochrysis_carterae.AAC.7